MQQQIVSQLMIIKNALSVTLSIYKLPVTDASLSQSVSSDIDYLSILLLLKFYFYLCNTFTHESGLQYI